MTVKNPHTLKLLERGRQLCEPQTWYQLGKRTGISPTTITRCLKHGKTLDNKNAGKLATLLGLTAIEVIAAMSADRAPDQITREFWLAQIPRSISTLAIVAALSFGAARGALSVETGSQRLDVMRHYAKRRARRFGGSFALAAA
jgi:hypothetical protein